MSRVLGEAASRFKKENEDGPTPEETTAATAERPSSHDPGISIIDDLINTVAEAEIRNPRRRAEGD